jgi:hypothetical protein
MSNVVQFPVKVPNEAGVEVLKWVSISQQLVDVVARGVESAANESKLAYAYVSFSNIWKSGKVIPLAWLSRSQSKTARDLVFIVESLDELVGAQLWLFRADLESSRATVAATMLAIKGLLDAAEPLAEALQHERRVSP